MQNNTIIRTALCGLLIATHATMAMETEPNSSLALSLESTPQGSPKTSPRNSQSGSQSPNQQQIDKVLEKLQTDSPRINPDNSPRQTSIPRSNSKIITSFTDTLQKVPSYPCINSRDLGNKQSEVTYLNDNNEKTTKILPIEKPYNDERYLFTIDETQGVVEKYAIDLKPELSAIDLILKSNLSGHLSNISGLPNDAKIYEGSVMQSIDLLTVAISYKDDNNELQTVTVENTLTPTKPMYALIGNNGKFAFAIDLQKINADTKEPKATETKTISSSSNSKNSRYILLGGAVFVAVLLAYQYKQLPAVFEKFLDQFFAMFTSTHSVR